MNTQVYIVRVWSEPNPGSLSVWRVSVMDATSQERWYFSSAERLVAFLRDATTAERGLIYSTNRS